MPIPPKEVSTQAEYGLYLQRTHKRKFRTMKKVITLARELSAGKDISLETIKTMSDFFKQHESDRKAIGFYQIHVIEYPTSGRIAWELRGGDAGHKWVKEFLGME